MRHLGGGSRPAILLASLLVAAACKTYQQQPFDRQAFEVLQITDSGVAAAERVFNALIAEGKVSQAQRDQAAAFHSKYVAAYRVAMLALGGTLEDQQAALASATAAASELLKFLNSFKGVSP